MTGREHSIEAYESAPVTRAQIEASNAEFQAGSSGVAREDVKGAVPAPANKGRGEITYDDYFGHVCTCTQATEYDDHGYPLRPSFLPTVQVARDVEPTNSGSYWYCCSRCGAGGWSGC